MEYPNEILIEVLRWISYDFIGYARVCKRWKGIFEHLKQEYLESIIRYSPFLVYSKKISEEDILRETCRVFDKYALKYLITKANFERAFMLSEVVQTNDRNLIKTLIEHMEISPNAGLCYAARHGDIDTINLFIELGADNLKWAISAAKQRRYWKIVDRLEMHKKYNPVVSKLKKCI